MKITRNTVLTAFAKMLDDRIDSELLMSHSDLCEEWRVTGLRAEDLDRLLEELYALHQLDRTVVGGESWYKLTAAGSIELRLHRDTLWERLCDQFSLLRLRIRGSTPKPAQIPLARRISDRSSRMA